MRYIRTKNGIYEIDEITNYFLDEKQKLFINNTMKIAINENQVISQADTIEELCDEFRYSYDEDSPHVKCVLDETENKWYDVEALVYYDLSKEEILTIRGAIWTDKGLIYVAKMDDKGELELI